jgi:hypothetical protein
MLSNSSSLLFSAFHSFSIFEGRIFIYAFGPGKPNVLENPAGRPSRDMRTASLGSFVLRLPVLLLSYLRINRDHRAGSSSGIIERDHRAGSSSGSVYRDVGTCHLHPRLPPASKSFKVKRATYLLTPNGDLRSRRNGWAA